MSEEGNQVELDPTLFVEEEETPEVEEPTPHEPETLAPEMDIPHKYQGKTAAEIIKMHQDAETLIGRQGNEVGELRKIVDDMLAATAQTSEAPAEPVDFFADPQAAIVGAVKQTMDNDPRLKHLEESAAISKKQAAANALASAHPDYLQIVNSPDFVDWVQKSPGRVKRFQQSHVDFDIETASEIIADYKERQSLIGSTVNNAKGKRTDAVKQAATGSGKASAETRGKPVLSRDALIELKRTNPDKYYSMMPQIKQAYMEDRVR
jgi:primosomal protein N'